MTDIPLSHPRYASLMAREMVARGVADGLTSTQGLIAQGRGEAFDYMLGEMTIPTALEASRVAVAVLLLARHPVLSVNGNVAVLAAEDMATLAATLGCPLEVNLFHRNEDRVRRIADRLRRVGAREVIGETPDTTIPGLDHARALATRGGIYDADAVLIPLEDGDRCTALRTMGKTVIAIDLNPLSRTAREASVAIVDNLVRAIPNMIRLAEEMADLSRRELEYTVGTYDHRKTLQDALDRMRSHLSTALG